MKTNIQPNYPNQEDVPSNIEAEHLLGSVMVNNEIIDETASIINF